MLMTKMLKQIQNRIKWILFGSSHIFIGIVCYEQKVLRFVYTFCSESRGLNNNEDV